MAKIKLKSKLNKSANSNWEIVDDLSKAQNGLNTPLKKFGNSGELDVVKKEIEWAEKQRELENSKGLYEPGQSVKNLKAVISGLQFSPNPLINLGARIEGTVADATTAGLYALSGQFGKASIDAGQALLNWVPGAKGEKIAKASDLETIGEAFNWEHKPSIEQPKQELAPIDNTRIIKKPFKNGGNVNTLEGDLYSKVLMNRNKGTEFVDRAYAMGQYPSQFGTQQEDFNSYATHLMEYGEDDNGQYYMSPSIFNSNNDAIKVPNQYADYISKIGYKNETGLGKKKNGGKLKKFQNAGGLIKNAPVNPASFQAYQQANPAKGAPTNPVILPEVNITAPRAQYPTYRGQLSQNARDGDAANRARIAEERNINSYKGEQGLGNDLIGQGMGLLLMPELRAAEGASALTKIGTEAFNAVNPFSGFGKNNFLNSKVKFKNTLSDHALGISKGLSDIKGGRPFFETFPITASQKANIISKQDAAFKEGIDFTKEWYYPNNGISVRPEVKKRILNIAPDIDINNLSGIHQYNPLLSANSILVKEGDEAFKGLSPHAQDYIKENKGRIGGVNFGNESITLRNHGLYYNHPRRIRDVAAHELGHSAQDLGNMPYKDWNGVGGAWGKETSEYDDKYGYFTSNLSTQHGVDFRNAMILPEAKVNGQRTHNTWLSSPNELHSELSAARVNYSRKNNVSAAQMQNMTDVEYETLINNYDLNKHFRPETSMSEKISLTKMLPAVAPIAIGAGIASQQEKKFGGKVSQWEVMEEGGDVTQKGYKRNSPYVNNKQNIINSGRITMKGVDFPVHGVDEYGNEQMMFPNGEYSFPGNQVIETRMKQNGGCLECEQKSLIKAQNGITHDKGRYNLYLDSLAAFNEGERLYEEDENYNPGRHSPKDDKYFNDVQRGLTHGFRGIQKSGTVDPSVMNKTHLTLPEWTNPTPISYRPLQTPIQFSPNQEEIKIEKVPNAPMPKWDGHKDYFTIIGDKSGAMYNQKTGRKLEYGGLLKAQKGVRTPKQQKIHLGQSMQSASFQYGGDTDMYGNDMLANIVFKDSPRSVYNPKLNQIEFGNDYDNADNEQENYMIAHENFHAKQYAEGKSRFEPNRNDLIVPPSMVASDENWNGYHDRKDIESNIDIDNFINDNPSFQFVPRPLIYNKEVDGAQYENPYSLEGEAQYYENSGEVPDSYKNGGSIWEVIEDVKKPLKRFQKGGKTATVSELWEQKTGTPWSEAKRQGLTDGTLNPNLKLRESLLKGIIPTKQKQLPVQQEQPNQFTNINTIQQIPDVLFENPNTEKQFIQVPPNTINPDTVYHSRLVERMDDPTAGFTVTLQDSNPDLMTPSIPGLKSKDEWGNYPLHIDAKGQVPKMKLSTTTGNPNIFKNEGSSCRDSDGKVIHECASGAQRALDLNTKVNRRDLGITGDGWSMTQNIIDKGGKRVYGFQNLGNSDISQFKNTNHTKGILDNSDIKKFLDDKRKEMNISDKDIVSNAQKGDFVEMWYKNSPNQDKALKESKGNVITTHIGMITEDEKGKKYVTHNVDGTWHTDPLDKALSSHKLKMKGDHRIMVAGLVRPDYFDNTNALETTGVQVDPNGKTYTSESPRTPITNANGWKIHSEKDGEQAGKYPLLKESMEFTKGLSYYAPEVQKDFGLSDKETEQLMKLSFGLFGKESGFGVTKIYKDKERKRNIYNAYKEAVPEWAPESDELSSGKGQIKLNTVFDTPEKKALLKKYGITKENIWDSQNSAAALLLSTAMNYKNFKRFSGVDFENADPITVQNVLALAHNKGLNNVLKNEFTSRDVRTPQEKIKGFFTGEKNNNRKYDVEPYADLNTKLKGLETYSNLHTDKSSYANLVADYSASLNVDYNKVKQLANTAGSYEPRQDQLPQTISEYVGENINKGVNFVVNPIIKTQEKISGKVKRVGSNVHKIDDKAEKIIGRVEKKGATFLKKLRKHQNGGVIGDWEIIN